MDESAPCKRAKLQQSDDPRHHLLAVAQSLKAFVHPLLQLDTSEPFHCRAGGDMKAGEVVMSIPKSFVISANQSDSSDSSDKPMHAELILKLAELATNAETELQTAYISSISSVSVLGRLQASRAWPILAQTNAGKHLTATQAQLNRWIASSTRVQRAAKHIEWAHSVVFSRSFSSLVLSAGECLEQRGHDVDTTSACVLPCLDLFNHDHELASLTWQTTGDTISFVLKRDLQKNDVIYNTYGPKSNEQLLVGYGFCLPQPQLDEYSVLMTIPFPAVCKAVVAKAVDTAHVRFVEPRGLRFTLAVHSDALLYLVYTLVLLKHVELQGEDNFFVLARHDNDDGSVSSIAQEVSFVAEATPHLMRHALIDLLALLEARIKNTATLLAQLSGCDVSGTHDSDTQIVDMYLRGQLAVLEHAKERAWHLVTEVDHDIVDVSKCRFISYDSIWSQDERIEDEVTVSIEGCEPLMQWIVLLNVSSTTSNLLSFVQQQFSKFEEHALTQMRESFVSYASPIAQEMLRELDPLFEAVSLLSTPSDSKVSLQYCFLLKYLTQAQEGDGFWIDKDTGELQSGLEHYFYDEDYGRFYRETELDLAGWSAFNLILTPRPSFVPVQLETGIQMYIPVSSTLRREMVNILVTRPEFQVPEDEPGTKLAETISNNLKETLDKLLRDN